MFNFLEKLENLPTLPPQQIIRNTQKNNNGNPIVLKSQNKKNQLFLVITKQNTTN